MKTPLRYQLRNFDCGSTSILNCISYLFDREEMPIEVVKLIETYSSNCYAEDGTLNNSDLTRHIMFFISKWINEYAKQHRVPLSCFYLNSYEVDITKIKRCLQAGGCVNMKTFRDNEQHNVMLVKIDNDYAYLFDPIYDETPNNENIIIDNNLTSSFNRKVKIDYFLSESMKELSMGPEKNRETILFFRTDGVLEREFV